MSQPVAIIGIGCRFPGAQSPEELWRLLIEGREALTEIPRSRFDVDAYYDPVPQTPGKICSRRGGFLSGVDLFDPGFFGIAPREAVRMDPQQRLLLEVAWEALEDAGQVADRLASEPVGVFMGLCFGDYEDLHFHDPSELDLYKLTGGLRSVAAGRISSTLGLRGPCLAVDAACASSLVVLHLACLSLAAGDCTMALAGGASLILQPQVNICFSRAGMLAPDGRCKFGDARADGLARSEGMGVVVLKPLSRALADGDPIYAVVRATATNNDGWSGGSMVTPGEEGQAELLREAYTRAAVAPEAVRYVEAHGTGTKVGDRVEITALGKFFGSGRPASRPLRVGSIKTNLGHAEGAAGMAGLIKVALALKHGQLPPSLHFEIPNPSIAWSELPVSVQDHLSGWPEGDGPRLAGVNSFGINGSNAHAVLEEAPATIGPPPPTAGRRWLLPLSAKSREALAALAGAVTETSGELRDLCYTAALRRTHHEHRLAVVAGGADELRDRLAAFVAGEPRAGLAAGRAPGGQSPRIAFVFPGQGSQWLGMGRELMQQEPVFCAAIERASRLIESEAGWSLVAELAADEASSQLDQVDVVQPALFAVQVALAELWRSWGIVPAAVVGQSLGEVAAATVAGALSLADGVRVICRRSRLVKTTSGRGGMAVVELSLAEAQAALAGREALLSIAVASAPRSTVLSGDAAALDELLGELTGRGVFCRLINVDYASHSPQMDPLRSDLLAALAEVVPRAGEVPIYSTVDASPCDGAGCDALYWVRNLREPVLFAGALERLLADGCDALIEISAHPVLTLAIEQTLAHWGKTALVLPTARREEERAVMLGSLGALFAAGSPVAWDRLFPEGGTIVPLPRYPWQRESFWLERPAPARSSGPSSHDGQALLSRHLRSALPPGGDFWEADLHLPVFPYLRDHRVSGAVLLPAAAILEMALEASGPGTALAEVRFEKGVFLREEEAQTVQLAVSGGRFQAFLREGEWWSDLAQGTYAPRGVSPAPAVLPELRARCPEEVAGEDLYRELEQRGLDYGPAFQRIGRLRRSGSEAVGELSPVPDAARVGAYKVHPALLDGCLQMLGALLPPGDGTYLPVALDRLEVYQAAEGGRACHARLSAQGDLLVGDATLYDADGLPVLAARGLALQPVDTVRPDTADRFDFHLDWELAALDAKPRSLAGEAWLIFADRGGLGEELAAGLAAAGAAPTLAAPGDGLSVAAGGFAGVVHLSSLDLPAHHGDGLESLPAVEASECLSAVALIQALAAGGRPSRVVFVTRHAQAVGNVDVALNQAPLWGLGRVAVYEHPELACRMIDLDGAVDPRALLAEIAAQTTESEVALRGTARYVSRWDRRHVGQAAAAPPIRADRSYLVTGGLGGLGLQVARWLADRGARHLALLGRSDATPAAGETLAALAASGVQVVTLRADVADAEAVARALDGMAAQMPPLAGVVHAAGLLADKTIAQLDGRLLAAVAAPKVRGAWVLHCLTAREDLDFFVLFSSVASLLGSPGQGNYSAANAFLDALAHYRRARGLPATAINWGAWGEVGLAARIDRGARLARRGLAFFAPRQGIAALERILARGDVQAAFVPFSLAEWQRFYPVAARLPKFSRLAAGEAPAAAASAVGEQLRAAPREERGAGIERYLRDAVARVLGLAPAKVDLDRPITRMGLDSLMAVEVRNRIEADLGLRLSMVTLLRGPSLAELSAQVLAELPEAPGEAAPAADSLLATVETMDEAALDNLLAELLEQEEAAP